MQIAPPTTSLAVSAQFRFQLASSELRDARGVALGSSNGAHHHRRSDGHIHVQRAATMGTAALTSEVLPPPQLRIHVRVAGADSKELLPGSEGSRLCAS